jgi:hypothetical protein
MTHQYQIQQVTIAQVIPLNPLNPPKVAVEGGPQQSRDLWAQETKVVRWRERLASIKRRLLLAAETHLATSRTCTVRPVVARAAQMVLVLVLLLVARVETKQHKMPWPQTLKKEQIQAAASAREPWRMWLH